METTDRSRLLRDLWHRCSTYTWIFGETLTNREKLPYWGDSRISLQYEYDIQYIQWRRIKYLPLSIHNKLSLSHNIMGIIKGITMVATLDSMYSRHFYKGKYHYHSIQSASNYLIKRLNCQQKFISMLKSKNYVLFLFSHPHSPVLSYPVTDFHLGRTYKLKTNTEEKP